MLSLWVRVALLAAGALSAPPSGVHTPQRGFVLTGWHDSAYSTPRSDAAIRRMAADGSDHVAIFSQWFISTRSASDLAPDPERSPSDASILHAAAAARAAGMQVTIKPQVGVAGGGWIGAARPTDRAGFWRAYRGMLLHYADLAERAHATTLVVGTELASLSGETATWRRLIEEARSHFHGALTYAANYDEFARIGFWDALDYIGVDAYFSLASAEDPAPPASALAAAWSARGYLQRIADVSARARRPVLFTEVGYAGQHSTAVHPGEWNHPDSADTQAQANAYDAFYRVVARRPWLAGFYWWEVPTDRWWVQDYAPIAKPAEAVMSSWNRRLGPASVRDRLVAAIRGVAP